MFSKKIFSLTFILFLMVSSFGYSQIITSKKVAIKKGIYQKPADKKSFDATAEKPVKVVVPEKKKHYRLFINNYLVNISL